MEEVGDVWLQLIHRWKQAATVSAVPEVCVHPASLAISPPWAFPGAGTACGIGSETHRTQRQEHCETTGKSGLLMRLLALFQSS